MHDLVIRGATVVDGTAGAQAFRADIAVDNGRITEIDVVRNPDKLRGFLAHVH